MWASTEIGSVDIQSAGVTIGYSMHIIAIHSLLSCLDPDIAYEWTDCDKSWTMHMSMVTDYVNTQLADYVCGINKSGGEVVPQR